MRRSALIAVLALATSAVAFGQNTQPSATALHWLDPSKESALSERINAAFADELKPDDPEKVKPYVAQGYKWISRVGIFGTSALVLMGERETRTSKYLDYFLAFNYDLKSNEKTPLTSANEGFAYWTLKRLVRFDSSNAPDIVFTYPSCTECEAEYLLSSFRFDSRAAKWTVRTWGKAGREILIGSDYSVGTNEDSKDDCLFKFADFNGDGLDDLAVRCLTISRQGKVLHDTTTLYTVQRGQPQVTDVKDLRQLTRIRDQLCVNAKKSKMCPLN